MMLKSCPMIWIAVLFSASILDPTRAPGQDRPTGPVTLVLAGPLLDPGTILKAVPPLLESGAEVLVPPVPECALPGTGSFRKAGPDVFEVEADLAAAYRLNARKTVRDHLAENPGRSVKNVIALYSGLGIALRLMREGILHPRHIIALDPDSQAIGSLRPPSASSSQPSGKLNIDVFLSRGKGQAGKVSALQDVLKKWKAVVRVFAADLRGRSLPAVAREMRWTLRGLRMAAVRPDGLHEIQTPALLADLAGADVVFAGEQHDNTVFHALQLELLKAMDRGRDDLLLSMEMFERDVQPVLDQYLDNKIVEAEFLKKARPWPNYRQDYRPLVEYARNRGIPVLAANVPRRHARSVAKKGLEALEDLDTEERKTAAAEILSGSKAYRKRFSGVMKGMDGDRLDRMFKAQCLKDDTMAESIHAYLEANPGIRRVLHLNGSFHSSHGLGTVYGLRKRRPQLKTKVVTCVAVDNPLAVDWVFQEKMDDFLVFASMPLPRPRRSMARHPGMPGKAKARAKGPGAGKIRPGRTMKPKTEKSGAGTRRTGKTAPGKPMDMKMPGKGR